MFQSAYVVDGIVEECEGGVIAVNIPNLSAGTECLTMFGKFIDGREADGETDAAKQAFEKAAEYKAAVSPISLWRALALQKLGDAAEADRVLDEMLTVAENKLANRDMRTYYGVGSPSPMPFEYDIVKQNTCEGSILKAFALLGYGKLAEAEETVEAVRTLDPYNFDLFIFDAQKGRICK